MQTVKAVKALPGRQEGSTFSVDDLSAASLKDRGLVEFVEGDAPEVGGVFVTTTTRRSGAAVTQVAAADYPEQPVTEGGETAEDGGEATEVAEVTKRSTKAELVAFALGKVVADDGVTPLTEAELESLDKPDLVAKLNLG